MRTRYLSGISRKTGKCIVFTCSTMLLLSLVMTLMSCIQPYDGYTGKVVLAAVRLSDLPKGLYSSDTSDGGKIDSYRFCMKPCFESQSHIENPSSGKTPQGSDAYSSTVWTDVQIKDGTGVLGYCTQGCWDVWVRAFNATGNTVFEGKTQNVYIGKSSSGVAVHLNREFGTTDKDGKAYVSKAVLQVNANTVKAGESTYMKISLRKTDSLNWTSESDMESDTSYNVLGRESFVYTDDKVEPGSYIARIRYVCSGDTVGSQIVSFSAIAGNTVSIDGSLDSGLFVDEGLTVTVQKDLSVSLAAGSGDDSGMYVCTASGPEGGSFSYYWYINGVSCESVSDYPNKISFPGTLETKGVYDITCVVSWGNGSGDSALSSATISVQI